MDGKSRNGEKKKEKLAKRTGKLRERSGKKRVPTKNLGKKKGKLNLNQPYKEKTHTKKNLINLQLYSVVTTNTYYGCLQTPVFISR